MTINDTDGMFALIKRLMERARRDAQRGDREAIAFLKVTTGESPMTDTTKLQEAVEQAERNFAGLYEEFTSHAETIKRAVNAKDVGLVRALKQRGDELPQLITDAAEEALLARLSLAEAHNRQLSDAYQAAKTKVDALQHQRHELLSALSKLESESAGLMAQTLGVDQDIDQTRAGIDDLRKMTLENMSKGGGDAHTTVEIARFSLWGRRPTPQNDPPAPGVFDQAREVSDVLREKYGLPRIDPASYTPRPAVWQDEPKRKRAAV